MEGYTVHWGNRLENLADTMFTRLYDQVITDPLQPCCIVTNSNIMQAWLRHYFVFDWSGRHDHILANCDFQLLYPFLNDWMDKLLLAKSDRNLQGERNPAHHPYSVGGLQWRIFRLLEADLIDQAGFAPIKVYLGVDPTPRRRFQLAGRLAMLLDDYQVYRNHVLETWERGDEPESWQAVLWRRLIREDSASYASLFRRMNKARTEEIKERFGNTYHHVAVFGVTAIPLPYLGFLQDILSQAVNVDYYTMNPSGPDWLEDVKPEIVEREHEKLLLQDHPLKDDPLMLPEKGHPLLCSLGQAMQEHLHALHEICTGGISDERHETPDQSSMLGDLQNRMLERITGNPAARAADDSIQIHICHSPRREVEILYDHLLLWFTNERLQPYQVQVLVTDMETYAPMIDAVFGAKQPNAESAIPYQIDGRPSPAESVVKNAFQLLLNIASSRFQAHGIVDLLHNVPVMKALGIRDDELEFIAHLIDKAGIRWGLDADHRKARTGISMEPYTSWEYGLTRLLAGYALGKEDPVNEIWPVDTVENESAETLGKLAIIIEKLSLLRKELVEARLPEAWQATLLKLLDTFFVSTNASYREVAAIRNAICEIVPLSGIGGMLQEKLPFDVVAAFLDGAISSRPKRGGLLRNAVVFGQLRPMNSRPSEVVCLLGLADGTFPRKENRPTFDLLQQTRHRGDRSIRRDDRCAFLEAMLNARQRLFMTYPGRSDRGQNVIPPSVVLQEFRDHLSQTYLLKEDAGKRLPMETLHRMQPTHPAYFHKNGTLFSYSKSDFQAALQLVGKRIDKQEIAGQGKAFSPVNWGVQHSALAGQPIDLENLVDCLQNPAKYYYRNILEVSFYVNNDGLSDEEPRTIDALQRYALNDKLMNPLLPESGYDMEKIARASLVSQAKANAQVPLGPRGIQSMECMLDETEAWLNARIKKPERSNYCILELLRKQAASEAVTRTIPIHPGGHGSPMTCMLRGPLKLITVPKLQIQLFARPSEIKARDLLKGWVSHLFTCACNLPDVHTVIAGKKNNKIQNACYPPVAARDAIAHLCVLTTLYLKANDQVLPFAPATSYEFACRVIEDPDKGNAAMEKAREKWVSDGNRRGERADQWLYHAFGDNGPIAHPDFSACSIAVFQPLLASQEDAPCELNPFRKTRRTHEPAL